MQPRESRSALITKKPQFAAWLVRIFVLCTVFFQFMVFSFGFVREYRRTSFLDRSVPISLYVLSIDSKSVLRKSKSPAHFGRTYRIHYSVIFEARPVEGKPYQKHYQYGYSAPEFKKNSFINARVSLNDPNDIRLYEKDLQAHDYKFFAIVAFTVSSAIFMFLAFFALIINWFRHSHS